MWREHHIYNVGSEENVIKCCISDREINFKSNSKSETVLIRDLGFSFILNLLNKLNLSKLRFII